MVVVDRWHSWVGLLVVSLLWKLAGQLLVPGKASSQEGHNQVILAKRSLNPASQVYGVFNNMNLVPLVGAKDMSYVFRESLRQPWPITLNRAPHVWYWNFFLNMVFST